MKACFVCKTNKWGKICESIKLYLQYCHDIAHIKIDICNYTKKENPCCDVLNDDDIVVIPLFEKDGSEIESNGLDIVKYLRGKNGYKFNTIFLVLSEQDIPDYLHPENDMHDYAERLLGNPKFGKVDKAIFLGEITYKKKETQNKKISYEDIEEYINIINLQERDALGRLADLIKGKIKLASIDGNLRESYYSTFVKYYECTENGQKVLEKVLSDCTKKKKVKEMLEKAQKTYNKLNNPDTGISSHAVSRELFLAPVPFPLQDLFVVKLEIREELRKRGTQNKIRLLLIDNKTDKFNKQTKPTIIEALEAFGIDDLFDIEMIGIEEHDSKNFNLDYEGFKFKKFRDKKKLENLDDKNEKEYYQNVIEKYKYKEGLVKTYSELIYNKIKSFHFILLDFFLNGENTYFAFDFIKDIAKIKNEKQDSSTTWYFITSAVYDSVVKYSQSGLLAEYYESAVVNAGDDPTNGKRQIIFVYKLLTFINARLKSFFGYKKVILEGSLFSCNEKKKKEECNDCLEFVQSLCRKYVAEYEEIKSLVADPEKEKKFKKNIELIDSIITHFIWLPEADWYMIQHQIDFINTKLGDLQVKNLKKCQFSCNYILKELEDRSEVY